MIRTQVINHLCNKINAQFYLEIGVRNPNHNFHRITVPKKIGIDPVAAKGIVPLKSDEFFSQLPDSEEWPQKYDVIFIDGLHHSDQVEKDIINSLNHLNDGGYIVCHDMNPTTKLMQTIPMVKGEWTGDCWKAWVKLRSERDDLTMYVVEPKFGCGIIQKGSQELLDLKGLELNYENLDSNRQEWLNLVSEKAFFNNEV